MSTESEAERLESLKEERISSELIFDGRILALHEDRVRLPDGGESVREWIQHSGAVAIVPVFEDGRTILVEQFRYAIEQVLLEVPAGLVDHPGESLEEAARRELEEETGYSCGEIVFLGSFFPCVGYSNEQTHVFLARKLREKQLNLDADENLIPRILLLSQAIEWAANGTLKDLKTVSALFMAQSWLSRQP